MQQREETDDLFPAKNNGEPSYFAAYFRQCGRAGSRHLAGPEPVPHRDVAPAQMGYL
jgi:hypothetical protein